MSPLRQEMTEKLPWLFADLQFRVVGDSYDPRTFGDCLVTLESDVIRLRFVKDRGQVLVQLRPFSEPSRWWHVVYILEAIRGERPVPRFDLEGAASMLRDNFPDLVSALGPGSLEQTRREIERYGKERLEAFNQGARAARAAAARKPRRVLQFVLIGSGLLLLAITMLSSFDQFTRIVNVIGALLAIAYGTVFRLRRGRGSRH